MKVPMKASMGSRLTEKCELDYFHIGSTYGGNQDWFVDRWMHMGGCAAAAACDSCIQLELSHIKEHLLPSGIKPLNRDSYVQFAMQMKPYLRPRWSGIDRLDIYVEGMERYLQDRGITSLKLDEFSADHPLIEAVERVQYQIRHGFPVPYLLLRHRNPIFKELLWHWFMIVGFYWSEEELYVKIATYGTHVYMPFADLWETDYKDNGGMILYA